MLLLQLMDSSTHSQVAFSVARGNFLEHSLSLPGISSSLTPEIVLNFCLRSSLAQAFFACSGARSEEIPLRDNNSHYSIKFIGKG